MLWESDEIFSIGDRIIVIFPDGAAQARVSRIDGRQAACEFDRPVAAAWINAPPMRQLFNHNLDSAKADASAETLGARIRRLRLDLGLTQAALAQLMGVSVPAVCGWEVDRSRPHPNRLAVLADALGVSHSELLGDRELLRASKLNELEAQVASARVAIAKAAGTAPDQVSIYIEW